MKKFVSHLIALFFVPCLLTACHSSPTIKVGLIEEMTGDMQILGHSGKDAAELAVKEINGRGGISLHGQNYKIDLIVKDSAADPNKAALEAEHLITKDQVVAIIGPNTSSNAIPVSDIAESYKTVMIAPWSTDPATTLNAVGQSKKYVFRVCFSDSYQAYILAKFATENFKAKTAAILYNPSVELFHNQAALFKKTFEQFGGRVVSQVTYQNGEKDYGKQMHEIKQQSPDIIFAPSYYTEGPTQIYQARQAGIKSRFIGTDGWASSVFLKNCGMTCEGTFITDHFSPISSRPNTQQFVSNYLKETGSLPNDISGLTYDAFGLLFQAISNGGQVDRESIRHGFAQIKTFQGVTGDMSYNPQSGDPIKGVVISEVKGGNFAWYQDVKP